MMKLRIVREVRSRSDLWRADYILHYACVIVT